MPPRRRGKLAMAAASGDRRQTLCELRDKLARDIETCESSRDVASMSLRLMDVLEQIDSIAPPESASAADEIAARRRARRPAS